MTQPGKLEISGNPVSEGQEKSRSSSIESPKSAQPSCLSEGFICLFRKKTEKSNSLEDPPMTDQNRKDKHGVRGKNRKVFGGKSFWLPCIRPAEKTERAKQNNGQMDKTDEQLNQIVPEEELKPYSKASFLRRIRGYRLMKEKDASGKEKGSDMNASKEGPLVEEYQEKQPGLDENATEPKSQEDMLGDGKDFVHRESIYCVQQDNTLSREQVNGFKEQEHHETKTRDLKKNEHEKDVCEESKGKKRKSFTEHESQEDKVEKLENHLEEQENQENLVMGQNDTLESCSNPVMDSGNEVSNEDGIEPKKNITEQEVNTPRAQGSLNGTSEHDKVIHNGKTGVMSNEFSGQEQTEKKVDNPSTESDNPAVKENIKRNMVELRTELSEQESYTEKVGEQKQVLLDENVDTPEDMRSSCVAKHDGKKRDVADTPAKQFPEIEQREKVEASVNYVQDKSIQKAIAENNQVQKDELENHFKEQNSPQEKVGETTEHSTDQQHSHTEKEEKAEGHSLEHSSHKEPDTHRVQEDSQLENVKESKYQELKQNSNAKKQTEPGSPLLEQCIENEREPGDYIPQRCTDLDEEPRNQLTEHYMGKAKEQRDQLLRQGDENKEKRRDQFSEQCMETEGQPTDQLPDDFTEHDGEPKVHLLGECTNHGGEARDRFLEQCVEFEGKPKDQFLKQFKEYEREPSTQMLEQSIAQREEPRSNCTETITGLVKVIPKEDRDKSVQTFTHTTCTTMSDEPHIPAFQETRHDNQKTNQEDKHDGNTAVTQHKDTEWESLQVEVQGMVQWLVQEASDNLTCFTEESHHTE